MDLKRFLRHVAMTPAEAKRAFPDKTMDVLARAIADCERTHRGEVVFVVEAELGTAQLWRGLASRDRAREVFAMHGVWNTEENNGVLIYVLLADHRVEIVADRGIGGRVEAHRWQAICDEMDRAFAARQFEAGALAGIHAVACVIAEHFPETGEGRNQLADRPIVM